MKNCCCYENGKCLWTKRYYENNIVPDCEKIKDCYYKQLKNSLETIKILTSEIEKLRNKEVENGN